MIWEQRFVRVLFYLFYFFFFSTGKGNKGYKKVETLMDIRFQICMNWFNQLNLPYISFRRFIKNYSMEFNGYTSNSTDIYDYSDSISYWLVSDKSWMNYYSLSFTTISLFSDISSKMFYKFRWMNQTFFDFNHFHHHHLYNPTVKGQFLKGVFFY